MQVDFPKHVALKSWESGFASGQDALCRAGLRKVLSFTFCSLCTTKHVQGASPVFSFLRATRTYTHVARRGFAERLRKTGCVLRISGGLMHCTSQGYVSTFWQILAALRHMSQCWPLGNRCQTRGCPCCPATDWRSVCACVSELHTCTGRYNRWR